MLFHREARRDRYDVIVVGSGIGGLTAAALLAKQGRSVLVVERHDRPGGYAHSFRRRRWSFDSAVHLVGGAGTTASGRHGLLDRVLGALDVRATCDFVRVDPFYTATYPGLRAVVHAGPEEFVAAHAKLFPSEARGVEQLLRLCWETRREAERAPDPHLVGDLGRMRKLFPHLVKLHRATLGEVMDAHLEDPRLRALFGTLWPYLGLPPSRVSFVYWATMLSSYVHDGAWYCRGTFQRLADALVTGLEAHGGEILLRSPVRRIRVHEGRACGVVLENGQEIDAAEIVSNVDAAQTFEDLIGVEHLPPALGRSLARMRPSISAFVIHAAARLDAASLGLGHENFFFGSLDHDESFEADAARAPRWLSITLPGLADPASSRPGETLLALTTLVPYGDARAWRVEKERYAEDLVALADRAVPGLRDAIFFAEAATPRTMERYTRNRAGALYGWALSPDQVGPARLPTRSPLPSLSLVGHWTRPGGGIYGVVMSGVATASDLTHLPPDTLLQS